MAIVKSEYVLSGDGDHPVVTDSKVNTNSTAIVNSTAIIQGSHEHPLETLSVISGDKKNPIATLLIGDPTQPISTDSKVELLNLPRFTLQDIKDMMKVRVRIPNYSQVCFKAFGQEFFSVCMNGESQVIAEPYVPNAYERGEADWCGPDMRPFPGDTAGSKQ